MNQFLCGIKFCGGCNPRYDRGAACRAIKNALSGQMTFEYAEEGVCYDELLVIGGCGSCCASTEEYLVNGGIVKLWEAEQLEDRMEELRKPVLYRAAFSDRGE